MIQPGGMGIEPLQVIQKGRHSQMEFPAIAAGNWIQAQDSSRQMLILPFGVGGMRLDRLDKGSGEPPNDFYEQSIAGVMTATNEAARLDIDVAILILDWVHGEADTTQAIDPSVYKDLFRAMLADYQADISALTNQTKTIQAVLSQNSSNFDRAGSYAIAVALWELARDYPDIYSAGPRYAYEYNADGSVHLSGNGYRHLGEMHAKVWQNILDGKNNWLPLHPIAAIRDGAAVTVTFHVPVGGLVLDTDNVVEAPNYGIEWSDAGDGNLVSIASVSIASPTTVVILLDSVPTGTEQILKFGLQDFDYSTGYGAKSITQPRTNIRDQDPAPSQYGLALYNWCIHVSIAVSAQSL